MPAPYVSSMFYIPNALLSSTERARLRQELTIVVDRSQTDPTALGNEPDEVEVKSYDLSVDGYFGVPRQYGFAKFPHLRPEDRTVSGNNVRGAYKGLKPIKPRNDQQADYFRAIANICNSPGIEDFVAVARTGSGKTAAQINAAIVTRSPILILVHTNRLKEQWLGSVRMKNGLRYFLGEEFVDNYVGIIQQDTCDFENKAIGIGLIHSVARRKYPKEFYNHWRVVAMDELHKHTAPNFAGAIMKFPQRIRGGMTATLREDALSKIAHWHYGPVRVTSEQKVLVPKVYFCRWNKEINARRINQFSKATTLTSLTELPERNELLAKLIYKRGYKRKRNVLVISDRVHQLQDLRKRVIALGANPQKLGLYTGRVYTGKWNCGVTIKRGNSVPDRHKLTLPDDRPFPDKPTARRAANEFIKKHTKKISRLNDKLVKRGKKPIYVDYETKIEEDYYTLEDAWYRLLEKRCSVFFTTYGIFEAGNDIARLDMGVEASPRADQRQPLGRILRDYDGKDQPEWYSMVDHLLLKRHPNEEAELLGDFVVQAVSRRRYLQRGDIQIANVSDLERMFSR